MEEKKQYRAFVDYERRVYSKPIEANSIQEAMEKFENQNYHMYDEFEYDEDFDMDSEEICSNLGIKEFRIYEEDGEEYCDEVDSLNQKEYNILKGFDKPTVEIYKDEYNELKQKARLADKYADVIAKLEAEQ